MLCRLCQDAECSEQSHIIPAFAYRWLKEISITGYLRGSENPNLRVADGPKQPFLCEACEDQFSIWEDRFAREVFYPIHRSEECDLWLNYDEWLAKFCVSLSWRALLHGWLTLKTSPCEFGHDSRVASTLEVWREFLLDRRSDVGFHRQHLLVLGSPLWVPKLLDENELRLYFERAIEHNSIHSPEDAYICIKLCRVLIVGTIFTKKPSVWQRTHVHLGGGKYSPGDFEIPGTILSFFEAAIKDTIESRGRLSDRQSQKIEDEVFKKYGVRPKK